VLLRSGIIAGRGLPPHRAAESNQH
jgi:hypothetical protein